jgi:hypothetical protein
VELLNIGLKKIDIEQKTQIDTKNTEIDTLALELKKTLRKIEQIGEDEEITLAENNLKEAQISLDQKIKKLEAYQIIAPF